MASTRIYRTMGTPTNDKIWTVSGWFKFHAIDGHIMFASDASNNTSWTQIRFSTSGLCIGSNSLNWLVTTRKFRDPTAWWHIVIASDSTQASASDRIKIYINGVRETHFSTDNLSSTSQDQSWGWNKDGVVNNIGGENASGYQSMSVSHFHNIDGTAYDASAFGETDSTTGEWKIKTNPSVTYGNNGFWWLKDDVTTTDHSPNSNTFTIGGTLTKTEDNPSNNFATWNPLVYNANSPLFKSGNTEEEGQSDGRYPNTISTLAMPKSGKFYAEFKKVDPSNDKEVIGIADTNLAIQAIFKNTALYNTSYEGQVCIRQDGNYLTYGSEAAYFGGGTFGDNDIFQIAFDGDNGAIYFGKNGTWGNSSDPTSGSSKTGAVDISSLAWYTAANDLVFLAGESSSGGYGHLQANFGNGYFGTTQVSSAGTNASGIGIFEYDVPTGYTALSTKGLNE